jgi:hypothetical protein
LDERPALELWRKDDDLCIGVPTILQELFCHLTFDRLPAWRPAPFLIEQDETMEMRLSARSEEGRPAEIAPGIPASLDEDVLLGIEIQWPDTKRVPAPAEERGDDSAYLLVRDHDGQIFHDRIPLAKSVP